MFELFQRTVREVNSRDYSPEQVAVWAPDVLGEQGLLRWKRRFGESTTLLAFFGDEMVGYANLEHDGRLDHFYVSASHQGEGIGTGLLRALEGEASKAGIADLFADVSITARPFFERHGFAWVASQEKALGGVVLQNFLMRKALTNRSLGQ